jgi:hypothetical protein
MAKKRKSAKKGSSRKRPYNVWTRDDIAALRRHSKERTPVTRVAKDMKRSEGTIRMKAYSLGLSMGHRRREAKKKARL